MPADRSSYNQHNFRTARGSSLVPYPSTEEAFRFSNTHAPSDDFSSLGLSDFFITHRQVACHCLDCLSLSGSTQELLSQGVQVGVRKLDLSQLCFSLNFYFPMFLRLFPSMFPLLTYSQSFPFLICWSPETFKTKEKQDFDSIDTGAV